MGMPKISISMRRQRTQYGRVGRRSVVPAMRVAVQITPFWRGTGGHAGDQVGAHIGGTVRSSMSRLITRSVLGARSVLKSQAGPRACLAGLAGI